MSCEHTTFFHVFSRVSEDANRKKTEVSNKGGCSEELNRYKRTQRPLKQTADSTGVSRTSIKRLWKEKVDTGRAAFSTPTKRYRVSRLLLVDDLDCEAIRQKIYHLYQAKEHVTLTKLLLELKRDNIFRGQRSILCILLREMGFK